MKSLSTRSLSYLIEVSFKKVSEVSYTKWYKKRFKKMKCLKKRDTRRWSLLPEEVFPTNRHLFYLNEISYKKISEVSYKKRYTKMKSFTRRFLSYLDEVVYKKRDTKMKSLTRRSLSDPNEWRLLQEDPSLISGYGVATMSRLHKITGLFCRISSLL